MTPNDTLMEQCRMEAEERYPINDPSWASSDMLDDSRDDRRRREGYAAALFHERSKPRTSLSVEEVMEAVKKWAQWAYDDELHENPMRLAGLRNQLTAKLNELNTQTNG